jgi:spermidine/putrescine transport system permease protein
MRLLPTKPFSRASLAAPVAALIGLGAVVPMAMFLVISVYSVDFDSYTLQPNFTMASWREVWTHASYWILIGKTLNNGLLAVVMTAIVGYPLALALSRLPKSAKGAALVILLTPLYTGEIVRVYAWRLVLGQDGLVNALLMFAHVISEPLRFLLFSPFATHLALFYDDLPFMALALWVAVERVDSRLIEAARDLGCRPTTAFRLVILPLTGPGLAAGTFMVFALAGGEALAPNLLGGTTGATPMTMIDNLFGTAFDWPTASALALTLLLVLLFAAFLLSGLALVLSGGLRPLRRSFA